MVTSSRKEVGYSLVTFCLGHKVIKNERVPFILCRIHNLDKSGHTFDKFCSECRHTEIAIVSNTP